jgi:hypothetical protein
VRLFFLSAGRQHLAPTSTERAPDRFKDFWRSLYERSPAQGLAGLKVYAWGLKRVHPPLEARRKCCEPIRAVSGPQGEPRQKAPDGARPLGSETICWIAAAEHQVNARRLLAFRFGKMAPRGGFVGWAKSCGLEGAGIPLMKQYAAQGLKMVQSDFGRRSS